MSSFCLHPGVIFTELGRHFQSSFPVLGLLLIPPSLLLMKTPAQGSQTTVYCAVTPGLEELSGRYFRYKDKEDTSTDRQTGTFIYFDVI